MEFVPAVAMVALILKLIDFTRYGVLTQASTWIAGVVVLVLVAQTNWSDSLEVGGYALGKLGIWSLVFYGMSAGSAASLDTLKAVDNTNSAAIPVLVPTGERAAPSAPKDVG